MCYTIPGRLWDQDHSLLQPLCALFSTSTTPSGQSRSPCQDTGIWPRVCWCVVFVLINSAALLTVFCQVKMTSSRPFAKTQLGRTTDSTAGARPGHLVLSTSRSLNLVITIGDIFNLWVVVVQNGLSHGRHTVYMSGLNLDRANSRLNSSVWKLARAWWRKKAKSKRNSTGGPEWIRVQSW